METTTVEILDRHQRRERQRAQANYGHRTAATQPLDEAEILRRIRIVAQLLDNHFVLPGTSIRFGLDALIGLVPGIGDLVTTAMGAYVIYLARQLNVPRTLLARMIFNVVVDMGVGIVPIVGDVADLAWKANLKNVRLLERHLLKRQASRSRR